MPDRNTFDRSGKRPLMWFLFFSVLMFQSACGQNLLINPDAEEGDISGWTDDDDAWNVADEVTPHGGDYFFWPGLKAIGSTMMYQDVDIPSTITGSASDSIFFHLSGWLCNWDQYPHDRATLAVEARDAGGNVIAYYQTEQRSPVWTYHAINAPVPPLAVTLRVILIATRFVGSDNDGYFDDLSLTVDRTSSPVVTVSADGNAGSVAIGSELELSATTAGATDNAYNWSSSFPATATVDSNGVVTGVAAGRVFIQAQGVQSGATGSIELSITAVDDIVFTSPVTGAVLSPGSIDTITWDVIGDVSTGELFISFDGGVTFDSIVSEIDCSLQKYVWSVPEQISSSRQCVVKMSWSGGDAVSGIFTIDSPMPVIRNYMHDSQVSKSAGVSVKNKITPIYLFNGRKIGQSLGKSSCSVLLNGKGKKTVFLKTGVINEVK